MMKLQKFFNEVLSAAKADWQQKAEGYSVGTFSPTLTTFINGDEVKFIAVQLFKDGAVMKKHTVLIGVKGGMPFIRCGVPQVFTSSVPAHMAVADFCYCHREKAFTGAGKVCHHMAFVVDYLLDNPNALRHVMEALGLEERAEVTFKSSPLEIGFTKRLPVLIYGQTGSGKTFQVLEFAAAKKLPLFQINMSSGLEDTDLLAKFVPDPETRGWRTVDGELWRAFKEAQKQQVIILIEELTRSTKSARNLLLKALDEKFGVYTLQNFVTGEQISVPRENIFWVATANIGYSDTEELDPALMRRFLIVVHQGYDRGKEIEILATVFGDRSKAERFYRMVVEPIRRAYDAGRLRQPLDSGTLKVFAELYHTLQDIKLAAQLTIINKLVDVDANGQPSSQQQSLLLEVVSNFEE